MDGSFHCVRNGVFVNDSYMSSCSVYLEDTPVKSRAVLLLQVLVLVRNVETWQYLLLGYFPQLGEQSLPNTVDLLIMHTVNYYKLHYAL